MNILIDIAHPAHVHLLKNVYSILQQRGHRLYVTVRDIQDAIELLRCYEIPYSVIGSKSDTLIGKVFLQLEYNLKMFSIVRQHRIRMGIGTSITIAQLSRLTSLQSIVFDDDDDEVEPLFVNCGHRFADVVLSPVCAVRKTTKMIAYSGYHELAYLHPNRFQPDPTVLDEIGVKPGERYFIMRFNAFKAHHDVGVQGLSIDHKRRLIALLEKQGKVFITTERNIDEEFKKYQLLLSPEKIHSLMYYATMLVGDSQTMTSEAAVLGTPAIRCNTFVGRISYLEEEEHRYELTYGFRPENSGAMLHKVEELLAMPNLKEEWQGRRKKMLAEKIDVTAFYVWFIENYPESARVMRENPEMEKQFRRQKAEGMSGEG